MKINIGKKTQVDKKTNFLILKDQIYKKKRKKKEKKKTFRVKDEQISVQYDSEV